MKKQKILVHSCCGPCSTAVIERLEEEFNISIFFYNPAIFPKEEYLKRLAEQKRYAKEKGIIVFEGKYDEQEYLELVKGMENEAEGGGRCELCFRMRLKKTAEVADKLNFDLFTTTLTVSPHKNSGKINKIGCEFNSLGLKFLERDFKKLGGYERSIEISRAYGLYRQNYCGCRFSKGILD